LQHYIHLYLGSFAGSKQKRGGCNVAIGCGALHGHQDNEFSLHNVVALGVHAGFSASTANHSIFIGSSAGCKVTTGASNIGMGNAALRCTTTGANNIALKAGQCITTGNHNVVLGGGSGIQIGSCGCNVFMGYQTGQLGGSSHNVAIGNRAGYSRGGSLGGSGSGNRGGGNVIFGQCAGYCLFCGGQNFFAGFMAGGCGKETTCTIAIGRQAGIYHTNGYDNTYIGMHAGNGCGVGGTSCKNIALGSHALYKIFTGYANIGLGVCAGACIIGGCCNTSTSTNIDIATTTYNTCTSTNS
jgi:hypothetical protein